MASREQQRAWRAAHPPTPEQIAAYYRGKKQQEIDGAAQTARINANYAARQAARQAARNEEDN